MNHIVYTCLLTKFEGGLQLLHEAEKDGGRVVGIYSDYSIHEMNEMK